MKSKLRTLGLILLCLLLVDCKSKQQTEMEKIIFLHHSTGMAIWYGGVNRYIRKLTDKSDVRTYFKRYNKTNKTNYSIERRAFPKGLPYDGSNLPYDYYNIWVKNAGNEAYLEEPTLEMLTKEYGTIIIKHCYPVSKIAEDAGSPDPNSNKRTLENYKTQYQALKEKMHQFPATKFIVWTPAVNVKKNITEPEAQRTFEFYQWMVKEWDEKGDNIYLWDFYQYETQGTLYLKDEYSVSPQDSHPNKVFSGRIAPAFAQYVIDVVEGKIE